MATEYKKTSAEIVKRLKEKIASIEKTGLRFPPELTQNMVAFLQTMPLYIGANASEANEPLFNVIEHDLFRTNKGMPVVVNLMALEKFRFPENAADREISRTKTTNPTGYTQRKPPTPEFI